MPEISPDRDPGQELMLLMLINVLDVFMPAVVYALAGGLLSRGGNWYIPWSVGALAAVVGVCAAVYVYRRSRSERFALATLFAVAAVALIGWIAMLGIDIYSALFLLFATIVGYRLHITLHLRPLSRVAAQSFRVDSFFFVVFFPMLALVDALPGTAVEYAVTVTTAALLYLVGRIYVLWTLERLETETEGASRAGLIAMIVGAVLVAFWGVEAGARAFISLFAAFALLMSPLVRLVMPVRIVPRSRPPSPPPIKGHPKQLHLTKHAASNAAFWHAADVALFAVVAIVAAWMMYGLWKRSRERVAEKAPSQRPDVRIRRKWVSSDDDFLLASTQDPERLRYQAWLKQKRAEGHVILGRETAREFSARPEVGADPQAADLTTRYERHRYGRTDG